MTNVMTKCALIAGLYPNLAQVQKESVAQAMKGKSKGGRGKKSMFSRKVTALVPIQTAGRKPSMIHAGTGDSADGAAVAGAPGSKSKKALQRQSLAGGKKPTKSNFALAQANYASNAGSSSHNGRHGEWSQTALIHPSSVNWKKTEGMESNDGWLLYHKKMKTSQVYLFDTTLVDSMSVLLFGGSGSKGPRVKVVSQSTKCNNSGSSSIKNSYRGRLTHEMVLDEKRDVIFQCHGSSKAVSDSSKKDKDSATLRHTTNIEGVVLVKVLRQKLDELFERKIVEPGTDITQLQRVILKALYRLLEGVVDDEEEEDA